MTWTRGYYCIWLTTDCMYVLYCPLACGKLQSYKRMFMGHTSDTSCDAWIWFPIVYEIRRRGVTASSASIAYNSNGVCQHVGEKGSWSQQTSQNKTKYPPRFTRSKTKGILKKMKNYSSSVLVCFSCRELAEDRAQAEAKRVVEGTRVRYADNSYCYGCIIHTHVLHHNKQSF